MPVDVQYYLRLFANLEVNYSLDVIEVASQIKSVKLVSPTAITEVSGQTGTGTESVSATPRPSKGCLDHWLAILWR